MEDSWNDGLFSKNNVADLDTWDSNSSFNANGAKNRSHGSSYSSPVSSSNWGYTSNHSDYYNRPSLNIPSHIKIEKLSFDTSLEKIRNIFGRYGKISRVVCDYRINEEKLYCWLDYEDKRVIEV
jgi:RNA-binding protein